MNKKYSDEKDLIWFTIAFLILAIIFSVILLNGCDAIGCHPTYDASNNAYGFVCGGKF